MKKELTPTAFDKVVDDKIYFVTVVTYMSETSQAFQCTGEEVIDLIKQYFVYDEEEYKTLQEFFDWAMENNGIGWHDISIYEV